MPIFTNPRRTPCFGTAPTLEDFEAIAAEARETGLGGPLYEDSLARALIVHLLRRYAHVESRDRLPPGGLARHQERAIAEFIEAHLAEPLDLKMLGNALALTPCLFARQFRKSFGQPPYAYVMARRLDRAKRLLARTALPIKAIAADCGFSDQAHLTRLFSSAYGQTPAAFRRQTI